MNSSTQRAIAAVCLWTLAAFSASVGFLATLAPHTFYDAFPLGLSWVDMLPPYNQHLVSDVGELYLAFTLLFAWAALSRQRALVVPLCTAWIVVAGLHFGYHATHLDGWDAGDAIAQTVSLGLFLVLPVVAIWAVRSRVTGPDPLAR